MKRKILLAYLQTIFFILFMLNLNSCKKKPQPPPAEHDLLVSHAQGYASEWIDWINRDGWDYHDGSTKWAQSVSYNYYVADEISDFIDKINESSVDSQTYWHQYASYRPGGRQYNEPVMYPWAGTRCQGLVYRSAIKAGYSIDSDYLNCIDCWMDLGTEVFPGDIRIGDIVLMDLDTAGNHPDITYEHIGIVWNIEFPLFLSAVAIYRGPFYYKGGIHSEYDYNAALAVEFPGQNLYVYNKKYIRLPE